MLQPLFATPAEKSWIEDVSLAPASRRSLSSITKFKIYISVKTFGGTYLSFVRIISLDMSNVVPGQFVNSPLQ